MLEKDLYSVPAQQSNLLQSDVLCKRLRFRSTKWQSDPEYPILSNTWWLQMLNNCTKTPHLIVELEDDQHVLVMSNLPLTCHPKEHSLGDDSNSRMFDLVVLFFTWAHWIESRLMFKVFTSCPSLGDTSLSTSVAFFDETWVQFKVELRPWDRILIL